MTKRHPPENSNKPAPNHLPNSAWAKWHNAGRDFIKNGGGVEDLDRAALEFFRDSGFRGGNAGEAIPRAFKEGARIQIGEEIQP